MGNIPASGFKKKLVVRSLQTYWRFTRGLTMGAQGVAIDPQRRIVLVRHTYRAGWHFPGGGVEKSETIGETVVRELSEEAGIVLDSTPQLFSIYANFAFFPSDHIALFVVRDWRQPIKPKPSNEIAEVGLFEIGRLPEETIAPVRRRLAEIMNGEPIQPYW
jgi:8-oxo-dGTP pyrophosphatase MutT (NUDIX family)